MSLRNELVNVLRALAVANGCHHQDIPVGGEFKLRVSVDLECFEERPVNYECKAIPGSRQSLRHGYEPYCIFVRTTRALL